MTIVIDTREQEPLPFRESVETCRGTLYSGDYSAAGCESIFAIERKSIPDLVSCCAGQNRERFEHELHRLRGYWFARLLVIGSVEAISSGEYRSKVHPNAVLGTLAAFEVRYIPVVFAPTPEAGARLVLKWATYFLRELAQLTPTKTE